MAYPYLTDILNFYLGTNIYLPIATFGAFVGLAILIATEITKREVIRLETHGSFGQLNPLSMTSTPHHVVSELAVIATLFGLFGAKLFDAVEHPQALIANPISVIFSTGGFSIYGGLIVGTIAGILFLKRKSIPIIPMLDASTLALALGYGIGRLGCQLSGDGDWGKEADMGIKPSWLPDWFWAQTYDNNVLSIQIPPPGVYPTPLYEAFISFGIFLILLLLRNRLAISGQLFCIYLMLSGFERFLIEKIRINIEYDFLGFELTQAQLISGALILVGFIGFLKTSKLNYFTKFVFSIFIVGALTACATC